MHTPNTQTAIDPGLQGRVAVKLFFGITDEWALNDEQRCILAGLNSRTTLHNWRKKVASKESIKLSLDTLERMSYLAGVYKG
ncbi:MAG TPA: DUF2384 domain-containing protein, partial [Rhodobacteraceae bacterium]|nr:DUF2384 domain-containing protein [Paracoccaceae bacterium]